MVTLIAAYKADGTCIGRCDAKCYMAKGPRCTCICGGKNHGVGRAQATENSPKVPMEELAAEVRRLCEEAYIPLIYVKRI